MAMAITFFSCKKETEIFEAQKLTCSCSMPCINPIGTETTVLSTNSSGRSQVHLKVNYYFDQLPGQAAGKIDVIIKNLAGNTLGRLQIEGALKSPGMTFGEWGSIIKIFTFPVIIVRGQYYKIEVTGLSPCGPGNTFVGYFIQQI